MSETPPLEVELAEEVGDRVKGNDARGGERGRARVGEGRSAWAIHSTSIALVMDSHLA